MHLPTQYNPLEELLLDVRDMVVRRRDSLKVNLKSRRPPLPLQAANISSSITCVHSAARQARYAPPRLRSSPVCLSGTFLTTPQQPYGTTFFTPSHPPSLPPSLPPYRPSSMSFNPCPAGAPPAWYPGEGLLSSTDGVDFTLSLGRLSPSQPTSACKAKGTLHLTNIRLLFIAAKPAPGPLPGGPEFSSFDVVSFRVDGREGGRMGKGCFT